MKSTSGRYCCCLLCADVLAKVVTLFVAQSNENTRMYLSHIIFHFIQTFVQLLSASGCLSFWGLLQTWALNSRVDIRDQLFSLAWVFIYLPVIFSFLREHIHMQLDRLPVHISEQPVTFVRISTPGQDMLQVNHAPGFSKNTDCKSTLASSQVRLYITKTRIEALLFGTCLDFRYIFWDNGGVMEKRPHCWKISDTETH